MPLAHAVLLGIHTLTVAEETSNSVRGPMSVSVVSRRGIYREPEADIKAITDRLKEYEDQLAKLFLLYSDVTTSSIKFKTQLEGFSKTAIALREAHVEAEIRRMFASGFDSREWPYPKLPKGVTIAMLGSGDITILQGEERLAHYETRHRRIKDVIEENRLMQWNDSDPYDPSSDPDKSKQ